MSEHRQLAADHAERASTILADVKTEHKFGQKVKNVDGYLGAVASAHAALALFHQREADRLDASIDQARRQG
jgi:hypothetical protein